MERRMNRLQNLLIMIPVTLYMMRYTVIFPLIKEYGFEFQLSSFTFLCLGLSLICMAAAGYAISDYFEKFPEQIQWDKSIALYIILCLSGILLGGYVTLEVGMSKLIFLYIVVAILLWMYSAIYKRQILIGNIIIAMISAMIPLSVLLDIPPIYSFYGQFAINLNFAVFWIIGIAIFIFVTVFLYAIIKDIEEFEANIDYDWKTLPFVMGDRYTKKVIIGINTAIITMLFFVYFKFEIFFIQNSPFISFFYLISLLIIPLLYITWKVYKAVTPNDYRQAGNTIKILWLAALAYSGFFF